MLDAKTETFTSGGIIANNPCPETLDYVADLLHDKPDPFRKRLAVSRYGLRVPGGTFPSISSRNQLLALIINTRERPTLGGILPSFCSSGQHLMGSVTLRDSATN